MFLGLQFSSLPTRSLAIQEATSLFPLLYHFRKEHFCKQLNILCREIKCNETWRSGTLIFKFCKHILKLITDKGKDPQRNNHNAVFAGSPGLCGCVWELPLFTQFSVPFHMAKSDRPQRPCIQDEFNPPAIKENFAMSFSWG